VNESEVFKNGCNMGARHARGRYLVFLSDSVVAEPGWLPEFYNSFPLLANPQPDPAVNANNALALIPTPAPTLHPKLTSSHAKAPHRGGRGNSPASQFESKQRHRKAEEDEKDAQPPPPPPPSKVRRSGGEGRELKEKKYSKGGVVGLLACKLVRQQVQQQTLHSVGMGVSLSVKSKLKNEEKNANKKKAKEKEKKDADSWGWWMPVADEKESYGDEEAREVVWHYRRLTGYSRKDERAVARASVVSPSHHCFAVSRSLFLSMDGMNDKLEVHTLRSNNHTTPSTATTYNITSATTTYYNTSHAGTTKVIRLDPSLQVLELSLRVKQMKDFKSEYAPTEKAVVMLAQREKESVSAASVVMPMRDDGVEVMNEQVYEFFESKKDALATAWLEESPARTASDVDLVWDFYGGCTGWGLEAVSFITSLEDSLKVLHLFFFFLTFIFFILFLFFIFYFLFCSVLFIFIFICISFEYF